MEPERSEHRSMQEDFILTRLRLFEFAISHSLEELLQKTIDEVGALTQSPVGYFHFVESDQKTLSLQAWSTRTVNEFCKAQGKGMHYAVDQAGVWVDCVHQRCPVIHNDYASLPHRKGMPSGHATVVRELVVPIRKAERIVAILGVGNKPTNYTEEDVQIVSFLADVAWEIVEHKRIEEALRKSEQEKAAILNSMSELVAYQDTDHTVLWTNKRAAEAVGKNQEDLKGKKCYEIWAHREKPCEMCPVKKAIDTGEIQSHEITTLNGRIWDIKGYPIKNDQGELVGVVETTLEVTQRRRAEQALRNAELEKKTILDAQPNLVILQDLDLSVIWANRSACESAGFPLKELIGKNCYEIWAERHDICPDCPVALSIKTGRMQEVIKTTPDGRTWQIKGCPVWNESGQIVSAVVICDNITERVALESQLHQARKLESIGNLAGGIAHEFNNILGIIIGNTELALDDVPEWNPAKECLKEIRAASLRAKDVVRQILSFARKTPAMREPIKISTIIKESLKLIRATIPATIEIRQKILCETEMIPGNPTEINQILINLCTNSVHAMDENSGILEIRLETIRLNDQSTTQYPGLPPGNFVKLTVKDSGHGIEPEIMDRVLDPYFTTKDIDQGLGMGLAVVYGIVKKYDGDIKIISNVDKGTTVEVLFPITEAQGETPVQVPEELPKGTERILVVDDEASLVKIIKRMLERQGYDVVGKTSSTEALKLFQAKFDAFDLIITDIAMPHMAGDRLAHELLKIRHSVPIILCTGHSHCIDEDKAKKLGIRAYVMKPLVTADFVRTVRKVLDESKGSVNK